MTDEVNSADLRDLSAAAHELAQLYAANVGHRLNIDGTPATLLPPGYRLQKHEELREHPIRTFRCYEAHTAESLLSYINRFADNDTMVFVDLNAAKAVAVLDYDAPSEGDTNGARWGCHRAIYTFPRTQEADRWLKHDGKVMSQIELAHFIEQHTPEIVDPPGAEMLEVALSLSANTKVAFKSGQRLDNGQVQITYQEEINGQAGVQGQLKIPTEFTLGIQLFKGGDVYQVDARLRYRIRESHLSMWYELIRPQRAVEDAVTQVAENIEANLIHGTLVYGAVID